MTKAEIIKKIAQQIWYFILAYITDYLFPKIKEAILNKKENLAEYLWRSLKADFKEHITDVLRIVDTYFSSAPFKYKEQLIIDSLFVKIKLPRGLNIFKPLLKNLLKENLHKFVKENLEITIKKLDTII